MSFFRPGVFELFAIFPEQRRFEHLFIFVLSFGDFSVMFLAQTHFFAGSAVFQFNPQVGKLGLNRFFSHGMCNILVTT